MKNEKMDGLIGMILKKKSGAKKEEETADDGEEEESGDSPKEAIANDLIEALNAGDAAAVVEALDAVKEAWASPTSKSAPASDEDCGCK